MRISHLFSYKPQLFYLFIVPYSSNHAFVISVGDMKAELEAHQDVHLSLNNQNISLRFEMPLPEGNGMVQQLSIRPRTVTFVYLPAQLASQITAYLTCIQSYPDLFTLSANKITLFDLIGVPNNFFQSFSFFPIQAAEIVFIIII